MIKIVRSHLREERERERGVGWGEGSKGSGEGGEKGRGDFTYGMLSWGQRKTI